MDVSGGYLENQFVVEYYDYIELYRQRQDISFFIEIAQHSKGPVLEVGCGTGRVLIPIAKAGISIVGIDISPSMISLCQRKLLSEADTVQSRVVDLVCGDMRQFSLEQKFNLIMIPFYTFNYLLKIEDQLSCLSCLSNHLNKEGKLVLDLPNPYHPYIVQEQLSDEFGEEPEFVMKDGRKCLRRYHVRRRDLINQIVEGDTIYYVSYPDGYQERLVNRASMRYLYRYEAEHLLARCGFTVEAVYSDFDKSTFETKYPGEMILLANKC